MRALLCAAALCSALSCAGPAGAAPPAGSDLRVLQPSAMETPAGATTGVVYLSIHNVGAISDRLVSVSTPAAAKVEIHNMTMSGSVMQMRPLEGVDIASGGDAEFVTGGMHLMLVGLKQPLLTGQHFPLTLRFQKAGDITVSVAVSAIGARHGPVKQGSQ